MVESSNQPSKRSQGDGVVGGGVGTPFGSNDNYNLTFKVPEKILKTMTDEQMGAY